MSSLRKGYGHLIGLAGLLIPAAAFAGTEPFSILDDEIQGEAMVGGKQEQFASPLSLMQVANPADAQKKPASRESLAEPPRERLRTWEMPPVTVEGTPQSAMKEEQRIGSYGQPRWTATRRFPGTRVYVVPEGKVEIEYWLRPTIDDGDTEIRSLYEIEFGLPYRFQLDIYLRTDQEGDGGEFLWGGQFEIRWALADWGKIWGNPTLYVEWVSLEERPDKFEAKLLLGDEIAPRWHWGVNLVGEFELGGEREYEYQVTGGLSYTIIDSVLSLGVESQYFFADVKEDRGEYSTTWFIGPSLQVKPLPPMTINFVALAGIGGDSPDMRFFLNIGYEF